MLTWIILVKLLLMLSNFFFCFISMNLFFLWYRHLSLVACVLDSSLIWTSRILNFECLFWFFLPQLPAENNNKYSIFKIQNLTSPNQWACAITWKRKQRLLNLQRLNHVKHWQTIRSKMAVRRIHYFLLFYVVPLIDSNYESINGTTYIK